MSKSTLLDYEYPLSSPYEFEGFIQDPDVQLQVVASQLDDVNALRASRDVAVVRSGENGYGTWGVIGVWNGTKFEHVGYTLEPRASVGKGPIPFGDYPFRFWMSPTLKKTLRLSNVSGFTDILIHVGNTQGETKGCILAAKRIDSEERPTRLLDSRTLTDWLYDNCESGTVLVRSV